MSQLIFLTHIFSFKTLQPLKAFGRTEKVFKRNWQGLKLTLTTIWCATAAAAVRLKFTAVYCYWQHLAQMTLLHCDGFQKYAYLDGISYWVVWNPPVPAQRAWNHNHGTSTPIPQPSSWFSSWLPRRLLTPCGHCTESWSLKMVPRNRRSRCCHQI